MIPKTRWVLVGKNREKKHIFEEDCDEIFARAFFSIDSRDLWLSKLQYQNVVHVRLYRKVGIKTLLLTCIAIEIEKIHKSTKWTLKTRWNLVGKNREKKQVFEEDCNKVLDRAILCIHSTDLWVSMLHRNDDIIQILYSKHTDFWGRMWWVVVARHFFYGFKSRVIVNLVTQRCLLWQNCTENIW